MPPTRTFQNGEKLPKDGQKKTIPCWAQNGEGRKKFRVKPKRPAGGGETKKIVKRPGGSNLEKGWLMGEKGGGK